MKKHNIYISGPMTGKEHYNARAFGSATAKLMREGHTVFNPAVEAHKLKGRQISNEEYRQLLSGDLQYICNTATAVYMLPGWELSPGACAEHATAVACKLEIMYASSVWN